MTSLPDQSSDHVEAVARIAEARGCIGPYPCGRAIPEFGDRDAPCRCEQIALKAVPDEIVEKVADTIVGHLALNGIHLGRTAKHDSAWGERVARWALEGVWSDLEEVFR
jgi:hypothetical protein